MATAFFKRSMSAQIGAATFEKQQMFADIKRSVEDRTPTATIDLWNLAPETVHLLEEPTQRVTVRAGYADNAAVIFIGETQSIEQSRSGMDIITKVKAGGTVETAAVRNGVTTRGYTRETRVRQIVFDLVIYDLKMDLGLRTAIPAEASKTYYYFNGPTTEALTQLLDEYDVKWYEENGVIRFWHNAAAYDSEFKLELSKENGMIGVPRLTEDGAEARSFLMPQALLDGELTLNSRFVSGAWRIFTLTHRAGNHSSLDFSTAYELRRNEDV